MTSTVSPKMPSAERLAMIKRIRFETQATCQYKSFAELAAIVVACQYLKKGRRQDARRILMSYLKKHPSTSRVAAALRLAC